MTDQELKAELIEWAATLADGVALVRRVVRLWKSRSVK